MSVTNESLKELSELASEIGLVFDKGTKSWYVELYPRDAYDRAFSTDSDLGQDLIIGRCRRLIDERGWEIHTHGNDVSLASNGTYDLVISSRSLCQNFVDAAIWSLRREVKP